MSESIRMKENNEEAKYKGFTSMTREELKAAYDAIRREKKLRKNENPEPCNGAHLLQIMREIREESERNGLSNMTLEEINAEIDAARREMEAEMQ